MAEVSLTAPTRIGMDISRVVVGAARARTPGIARVVSDVRALPFRPASIDLVVSISTLDHLPPAAFAGAVVELCRVLGPDGCLILTLDSGHNPVHVLSNRLRRRLGMIHAERCYRVGDVLAALAREPVAVTDVTTVHHVPPGVNFLAKRLGRRLGARGTAWVKGVLALSRALGGLPTRGITGRYIALRIVRRQGPSSAGEGIVRAGNSR